MANRIVADRLLKKLKSEDLRHGDIQSVKVIELPKAGELPAWLRW